MLGCRIVRLQKRIIWEHSPQKEKEKTMKKLIALLMILAVVLTGVFAYGADKDGKVTVSLKGSIGGHFEHGVVNPDDANELLSGMDFTKQGGYEVLGENGTTFSYGFRSNMALANHRLFMKVGNFLKDGDTTGKQIQIESVSVANSVNPAYDDTNGILLYETLGDTSMGVNSKAIIIVAAQDDKGVGNTGKDFKGLTITHHKGNASDGGYTSTLEFNVVGP